MKIAIKETTIVVATLLSLCLWGCGGKGSVEVPKELQGNFKQVDGDNKFSSKGSLIITKSSVIGSGFSISYGNETYKVTGIKSEGSIHHIEVVEQRDNKTSVTFITGEKGFKITGEPPSSGWNGNYTRQ